MLIEPAETEGRSVVVRRAESGRDRRHLRETERWLRRAAHPGVVQLLASDDGDGGPDSVTTARIDGPTLAEVGPLDEAEVAGIGAVVATTLADLHELGVVHGDLRSERIVLDADDGWRPVLLEPERGEDPGADQDVAALAGILRAMTADPSRRLRRLLERSSGRHAPTARALAAGLIDAVPGAQLPASADLTGPGPTVDAGVAPPAADDARDAGRVMATGVERDDTWASSPADEMAGLEGIRTPQPVRLDPDQAVDVDPPAPPAGPPRRTKVAVGVLVVLVLGFLVTRVASHPPARARTSTSPSTTAPSTTTPPTPARPTPPAPASGSCPAVDAGCGPVVEDAGRFRAGGVLLASSVPHPVIVLGRWWCGAALPVALDRRSGQLWVWRAWPGRGSEAASPLGRVPGADGLETLADPGGCDILRVPRRSGPPVLVDVASVGSGG